MRPRKVIQILNHSPSITPAGNQVIYDGWPTRVARNILKKSKKYEIKVFIPERNAKTTSASMRYGITHKIFPSKAVRRPGYEVSWPLIREIIKESKENDILLHIHGAHYAFVYLLAAIFGGRCPIVIQHHGNSPLIKFRFPLRTPLEKYVFRHVDHFFTIARAESEYLSRIVDSDRITFQGMGVDFKAVKPLGKAETRKKLGLPHGKKIILYAGKLYRLKGCDYLIDAFNELKKKYDVELVMVGGSEGDELYSFAKKSGARVIGRLPHEKFLPYLSAADVYVLQVPEKVNEWFGIGVAVVEALACNTPVVGSSLLHFPDAAERKKVGVYSKPSDLASNIEIVLKNPGRFKGCREYARKYYDWDAIAGNTLGIYDKLFKEYYG